MKKLLPINGSLLLLIFLVLTLLLSCNNKGSNDSEEIDQKKIEDSLISTPKIEEEPELIIKYRLDSLATAEDVDSLFSMYSKKDQDIIFALNRIEPVRVGEGGFLVIPDTLLNDLREYSPFPEELVILDSIPKAVLIAQRIQAFALYENGKLLRWGPVSAGKQSTPTPNGLHYANYKAKRKVSTVNDAWILPYYFNFMNFEGVGVHQYLLPGFPASHACVRLYMEDAQFIYDWANQWQLDPAGRKIMKNGTPFLVFGEYDFEGGVPWLNLLKDPTSNNLLEEELKTLEKYREQYFKDNRNFVEIPSNDEKLDV